MKKLTFRPFDFFVQHYTTAKSRSRSFDSQILEMEISDDTIVAKVQGSLDYSVEISYNEKKVQSASCTCKYNLAGHCKHIINVLMNADPIVKERYDQNLKKEPEEDLVLKKVKKTFVIENQRVLQLKKLSVRAISNKLPMETEWFNRFSLRDAAIDINSLKAEIHKGYGENWVTTIEQVGENIQLSCSCGNISDKLCVHQHFLILEILNEKMFQLPFDEAQRHKVFMEKANEEGISKIDDPDDFFEMSISYNRVKISPKYAILSLTNWERKELQKELVPDFKFPKANTNDKKEILIIHKSEYNNELIFKLMEVSLTKSGGIKSPINDISLTEKIKASNSKEELLFFSALLQQNQYEKQLADYTEILHNPLNFPYYYYDTSWHVKKVVPQKLQLVTVKKGNAMAKIEVKQSGEFYVLTCEITVDNKTFQSKNIHLSGSFFISGNELHYIENTTVLRVLSFFKKQNHEIYIHQSQFNAFKTDFLDKLEQSVTISYSFIKKAPAKLIKQKSLDKINEYLIYLSESEDYILITPVISYGEVEVPVLSRRTVYTENPDGTLYSVQRDETAELRFVRSIQDQHPSFSELPQTEFFFLHKQEFLDQGWFVDAFEEWRNNDFSILGFSQLKNNRLNANKMKVQTSVNSGIDWFDVKAKVSFGNQTVGLKEIQKSILNKTRYIQLGDGTQGLMPQEWIDKFSNYFRSGEIKDGIIRTHKSNFQLIDEFFEEEVLDENVRLEIKNYKDKLANFDSIKHVEVPKKLKGTLRDYQKEGLNWLNFLDEFGFGGCLADDMGLGKTIQIIAYFLSQHEKGNKKPNLVIVPTSLLFNWQKELDKFAPHLKYIALYGIGRDTKNTKVSNFDVVLTTYGTLLADVELLKKHEFNIIVLDESQAIKNPDSKRYKAVRLLHGRQRLVVTGTPVENNTFDLFSQLSFAIPGLLGSAKQFATDYSTPIDKFQDTTRAKELQKKVHPFILRRTKQQVAKELPEKTEMVIYCEMGTEQRRVYDTYKIEFQKYLSGLSDEELSSSSLHILQGLTKMRQICNSPALLSDEEFYGSQSAKMDELMAQISNLKGEHKILIFSQFVGMLDLIKTRFDEEKISYAYLSGQTKNREEQVDLFQNDDNVRIFLISLKAGGTGLNLTKAEYVFLVDPWWNPAVENQAIDRAHRIGQKNKVVAVRLITPNSIEEKILELQQRKRELATELIHTDNNVLKQLTKEDLMGLI